MQPDFVVDFLLPVAVLSTGFFVLLAVMDGAMRLWAWARGEDYESPINW